MPILQQIPIRLQVSTVSSPPVAPFDYNTGEQPQVWRAQTAAIDIGVFDAGGDPVDLSNLTMLQLILQASQDALETLVVKEVLAVDITTMIGVGPWKAGSAQNAQFILDAADLDQNLLAQTSREFWLVLRGTTEDDAPIIYGAGPITIVLASNVLPTPVTRYVARSLQTTEVGNFTVTPAAQVHTAVLDVIGDAREVSGILGIIGVQDGARLYLNVNEPSTADIVINFRSGIVTNPILYTITTGTVLNGQIVFYFDADESTWVVERVTFPAVAY